MKAIFKDSNKIKRSRINVLKSIYICISWFNKSWRFPVKNADVSRRYNCAKFHHWICVTDLREGGLFGAPIREQPGKGLSWIGLNTIPVDYSMFFFFLNLRFRSYQKISELLKNYEQYLKIYLKLILFLLKHTISQFQYFHNNMSDWARWNSIYKCPIQIALAEII